MCILIITTQHPDYPLILLSNRDEFLNRPTAPAAWWKPDESNSLDQPSDVSGVSATPSIGNGRAEKADVHRSPHPILSGRDLRHPARGTWLGVTRKGRIAVLTNFRDQAEDKEQPQSNAQPIDEPHEQAADAGAQRSRGEIPKAYLSDTVSPSDWATEFLHQLSHGKQSGWGGLGGFSLFFAEVRAAETKMGIISNRAKVSDDIVWLGDAKESKTLACALSNTHFGDETWPKVLKGQALVEQMVLQAADQRSIDEVIAACFEVLSSDTMPAKKPDEPFATYARQLRQSVFIPKIENDSPEGPYGTEKQTVVLVDSHRRLTYIERTLFDNDGRAVPVGEGDLRFEFQIVS